MPDVELYGWDNTNKQWVKVLVDSTGRFIIDPTDIFQNPPEEDDASHAPTSEWAYDHWKDPDAHHARLHALDSALDHSGVITDTQHGVRTEANAHAHSALSGIGSSDHHVRYADSEAVAAAKTVKLDAFTAPDDGVVLDASNARHGLLLKLIDDATKFLRSDGGWQVPAAGGLTSFLKSSTRSMQGVSADVAYTGVGFKPTMIIAFTHIRTTTVFFSYGFCDSAKNQACIHDHGAITYSADSGTYIIEQSNGNAVPETQGQIALVKSFDVDGFTLTWTLVGSPTAATISLYFLCLK